MTYEEFFIHVTKSGSEFYFVEPPDDIPTFAIEIIERGADYWIEEARTDNDKIIWLHNAPPLLPVPPGEGWTQALDYTGGYTIWHRRRMKA